MKYRVSVLIPVYNGQSTIESAIRSVLSQRYTDLDVVVVNDGSTDATADILEKIGRQDGRLRIIHTPQGGIINALNTGIAECEGELIARMDADDICHPDRIGAQVEMMDSQPDLSVCSTLIKMFPRGELLGGLVRYEEWLNSLTTHEQITRDFFIESPVAHPSVMLRKQELIEIGGYQERGWAEDYDLWLRYYSAGKRFAKVPATLFFWRQSSGRLTFTDSRYSVENFLRAKAYYLTPMLKKLNRPLVLWGAGKTGRRIIKHLLRNGLPIRAIVDIHHEKIGHRMRGVPVVPVDYLLEHRDAFVLTAVSSLGARELIRQHLLGLELVETRDFICAA